MLTLPYKVTLFCYCATPTSSICLAPLVRHQAEAESPQDAAYLVMSHHGYPYVDRVEVTLPDGAVWQRNQFFQDALEAAVLGSHTHSVALWRTGRQSELPIISDLIQADSPLLAALSLMTRNKLTYVARASVRCPDGAYWRKEYIKLEKAETETEQEEITL